MSTEVSISTATHPRQFGRKRHAIAAAAAPKPDFAEDIRLFVLTFAGGFLFMSVFLA